MAAKAVVLSIAASAPPREKRAARFCWSEAALAASYFQVA